MTRYLVHWIEFMSPILLTFALFARVVGGLLPPNPALVGFSTGCEGKPQPCWYGIIPGETTADAAEELMAFAGEPELSRSIFSRDFTLTFQLADSPYCRAAFEFVEGVAVRGEMSICHQPAVYVGDLAVLLADEAHIRSLPPHELVYGAVSINVDGWPSPYSRITHIHLLPPNARYQPFSWGGLLPQRRYCQLVPDYPLCY